MKIIIAISTMALTLVGMRPADATTYTPAGTFVLQGTGLCTLTVTQSLGGGAIVCNVRATLNLVSATISIIP
jgi:hypothetical protein